MLENVIQGEAAKEEHLKRLTGCFLGCGGLVFAVLFLAVSAALVRDLFGGDSAERFGAVSLLVAVALLVGAVALLERRKPGALRAAWTRVRGR